MTTRKTLSYAALLLALIVVPLAAETAEEAASMMPEVFMGSIIDAGGALPGANSARFTLHIDEYTTDDEARELLQILADEGPNGLEKAMRKLEKGWVRIGPSLGYPVSVTRTFDTESGRIIRVATDRPVQMFEVWHGLRSQDHPFGVLELQLDANGKGEGRLIAAAEVGFGKEGSLEIESLGTQPFRLLQVKKQEPKKSKKKKKKKKDKN